MPTGVSLRLRLSVERLLAEVAPLVDGDDLAWLQAAAMDDERWWQREYGRDSDPSGLFCEANVLRYRPRPSVVVRAGEGASERNLVRSVLAAVRCGVDVRLSSAMATTVTAALGATVEDDRAFAAWLGTEPPGTRARCIGPVPGVLRQATLGLDVDLVGAPVTASGRLELLWFLREQSISRTLHRYGNVPASSAP